MNQWLLLGAAALRRSRKLKVALIAGVALLILLFSLAVWAAIALFGWLGGQLPAAWEAVKEQAPAVTQKIEEVAPGAGRAVEKWLPRKSPDQRDVAGEDLGGIPRFDGLVRTRFAVENGGRAVTYEGQAPFRAVADHYAMRFLEKGWPHRVLFAKAGEERHEYLSNSARYELRIKEAGGGVTVTIRETPLAAAVRSATPSAMPGR